MKTTDIAVTAANHVTDATLNAGPARLLAFLQGACDPAIRAKFAPLGWSDASANEAWGLLEALKAANVIPVAPEADPVAEAIAACETWQGTGLVRARAMLQLRFPEQAAFMFHDFAAGTGTAAVLNVSSFLQRRQQLEDGVARKGSRKVDHEALALLDANGVTKAVIKDLGGLVEMAQRVVAGTAPEGPVDEAAAKRTIALRKIHAWLTAWSDMARTVITRRDHLIRLGIAKRRARKAKASVTVTPPAPPVAPAPSPVPPQVATPVNESATNAADEPAPESHAA